MAEIGHFGKQIVFEVSDKKVLTFKDFSQKVTGVWSSHKTIGEKPKKEFNGADSRRLSFTVDLDVTLGVRPREVIERLENAVEKGSVEYLVIGGRMIGNCRFVITEVSEAWNVIYSKGELAKASVNISMEEYR